MTIEIHQQLSTWEGQVPTQLLLHGVACIVLSAADEGKGKVQGFWNTT